MIWNLKINIISATFPSPNWNPKWHKFYFVETREYFNRAQRVVISTDMKDRNLKIKVIFCRKLTSYHVKNIEYISQTFVIARYMMEYRFVLKSDLKLFNGFLFKDSFFDILSFLLCPVPRFLLSFSSPFCFNSYFMKKEYITVY